MLKALLGLGRKKNEYVESHPAPERTKLKADFVLPVLSCECVEVKTIEDAKTIVWKHSESGQIYHQDCSVVHPDNPGRSDFYLVNA